MALVWRLFGGVVHAVAAGAIRVAVALREGRVRHLWHNRSKMTNDSGRLRDIGSSNTVALRAAQPDPLTGCIGAADGWPACRHLLSARTRQGMSGDGDMRPLPSAFELRV